MSEPTLNPSAIGDSYGHITKIRVEMLLTIAELLKQQEALKGDSRDSTHGTFIPIKADIPPTVQTPSQGEEEFWGRTGVCTYVGDDSTYMALDDL